MHTLTFNREYALISPWVEIQSLDLFSGYFTRTSAGPVCVVIPQKAVCSQDDQPVTGHLKAGLPWSGRDKVSPKLGSGQSTAWPLPWLSCCSSAAPRCCRRQHRSSPSPRHRSPGLRGSWYSKFPEETATQPSQWVCPGLDFSTTHVLFLYHCNRCSVKQAGDERYVQEGFFGR